MFQGLHVMSSSERWSSVVFAQVENKRCFQAFRRSASTRAHIVETRGGELYTGSGDI